MALDIKHWNAIFLDHYANHNKPFRQGQKYGIEIRPVIVQPGQEYWACVGVKHLTGAENRGNHNAYCDVLDASGKRINMARVRMVQGNQSPVYAAIDKPDHEAGTNFPIWNGDVPSEVSVASGGPSEVVTGIRTNHADEGWGNTIGHHSFYMVWKKVVAGGAIDIDPEPDRPGLEPGEIEQVENITLDVGGHQVDIVVVVRIKPKEG